MHLRVRMSCAVMPNTMLANDMSQPNSAQPIDESGTRPTLDENIASLAGAVNVMGSINHRPREKKLTITPFRHSHQPLSEETYLCKIFENFYFTTNARATWTYNNKVMKISAHVNVLRHLTTLQTRLSRSLMCFDEYSPTRQYRPVSIGSPRRYIIVPGPNKTNARSDTVSADGP